jgi:hypothetical protein
MVCSVFVLSTMSKLGASFKPSGSARGLPVPLRDWHFQSPAVLHSHVSCQLIHSRCRNIKPASSIAYAVGPLFWSLLTLVGLTFPSKHWFYGVGDFNPSYRYSCLHSRLWPLHRSFPSGFKAATMLPYQSNGTNPELFQSFGIALIANHFRRGNTR